MFSNHCLLTEEHGGQVPDKRSRRQPMWGVSHYPQKAFEFIPLELVGLDESSRVYSSTEYEHP